MFKNLLLTIAVTCFFTVSPVQAELPQTKIKVGIILPLSGSLSAYGAASRNGLQLAVNDNPEGFNDIEFFYEDSAYEGKKSVSSFHKLINIDKADLIYIWGDTPSASIAPIVKQKKIPTVVISTDSTLNVDNRWVITFQSGMDEFGRILSSHLIQSHIEKIAIIKTSLPYYLGMVDSLNRHKGDNIKIVFSQEVNPDEMDFKSIITKLKNVSPSEIGAFLLPGQIAQFYKQASDQGLKFKGFGTEDLATRTEIDAVPQLLEGAVFPGNHVSDSFSQKYVDKFHDDSHLAHAGYAYEFGRLLPVIFQEAGQKNMSNDSILNAFAVAQVGEGPLGLTSIDINSSGAIAFKFPVVMRTIYKGHAKDTLAVLPNSR